MKILLLGALLLLAQPLHAVAIFSELGMSGIGLPDANLGSATTLGSMSQRRTHTTDGVFDGITVGSDFVMNPLNLTDEPFMPYVLWSVMNGGNLYEFTLESTEIRRHSFPRGYLLFLSGDGFITTNGENPSDANFAFSTQQGLRADIPDVRVLSWSSTTTSNVNVPEGGIGIVGFMASMWGLSIIRRLC
jgi:hypothetical protein